MYPAVTFGRSLLISARYASNIPTKPDPKQAWGSNFLRALRTFFAL
jgi:hypothetical protein